MDREKRLRRVLLICAHFTRNMAYYRAGWRPRTGLIRHTQFWITANGNFLDIAVLEWCKLFADRHDKHHWRRIMTDRSDFEDQLTDALGPGSNADTFRHYIDHVRRYRDKFVAHLDDDEEAVPPPLDDARAAVGFYLRYVMDNEGKGYVFRGLPTDLDAYYDECYEEARREYENPGP